MFDQTTQRGITIALNKPALVTGTVASITTTVTSSHVCNGKFQTPQTALTNATTPVLDYNTGLAFRPITGVSGVSGQGTVVVFGYLEGGSDAIGSVKCMQGSVESLVVGSTDFQRPPQFPAIPNNICPFAYMILKQTSQESQAALFGTTDWAAGDYFTNAIVHVAQLPVTPQTS
jgi:hypothetical protein